MYFTLEKKKVKGINIRFRFATTQPLDFTATLHQKVVKSITDSWKCSDIYDAVQMGKFKLRSIANFDEILPLAPLSDGSSYNS